MSSADKPKGLDKSDCSNGLWCEDVVQDDVINSLEDFNLQIDQSKSKSGSYDSEGSKSNSKIGRYNSSTNSSSIGFPLSTNKETNKALVGSQTLKCHCCCCFCRPVNRRCTVLTSSIIGIVVVLLIVLISSVICLVEFEQCDRTCSQLFCGDSASNLDCYFSGRYTGTRHSAGSRKLCNCYDNGTLMANSPVDRYMSVVDTKALDASLTIECCVPDGDQSGVGINVPLDSCNGKRLHVGACGGCSNINDYDEYVRTSHSMTKIAMIATVKALFNKQWGLDHYNKLTTMTDKCVTAWLANSQNTIIHCFGACAFGDRSSCGPDGKITPCFACDEGHSGFLFRNMAGMTRRRSGIETDICRDPGEIVPGEEE